MTDGAITMSIDMKKCRIRIHKHTLHVLGDPLYIQILINTESKQIAIRRVDVPQSGDQSRKTNVRNLDADESCEYYSETLTQQLHNLDANLDYKHTYRLTGGKFIKTHQLVLFDLSSMERVES